MKRVSEKSLKNLIKVKKGEVKNPKGRPPDVLGRAMRQLTAEEFAKVASTITTHSIAEVRALGKDESKSALQVMVAAVAARIMSKGDMAALDLLLNRIVGKVKERVEVTEADNVKVIITLPSNGREAIK